MSVAPKSFYNIAFEGDLMIAQFILQWTLSSSLGLILLADVC